jgi:hypothetical protein
LPQSGIVFMRDSGELHVFALPRGSAPVHQFIRGLPANLALGDDASAPTRVTVLEPLRFDAITLFPAYYLTREVTYGSPQVTLAAGTALHRVERVDATRCDAYVGFSQDAHPREFASDGGQILGQYAPDLEVGPVRAPCEALGGVSKEAPRLDGAFDEEDGDSEPLLRLTPVRDEEGYEHYEATELEIFARPLESSERLRLAASASGAELLASHAARQLAELPGWKKIRLVIREQLALEGWVTATAFEPDRGAMLGGAEHGRLGGHRRSGSPPTYCTGTLAAGTPIFSASGVPWASVASKVEAAFERGRGHLRLVNFLGAYRDAFCSRWAHGTDSQGIADCVEDAEVRPGDVTLRCPAGNN